MKSLVFIFFACAAGVFSFECSAYAQGQEFDPQLRNDPPEFTTAVIKDGILKFVAKGVVADFRTGVEEILVPKSRLVEKPVTIKVPYTVEIDGRIETRYSSETKIEKIEQIVMEPQLRTKKIPTTAKRSILHEVSLMRKQFQFMTVAGEILDKDSVERKLEKWTPAILLRGGRTLSPYFKKLLNPETVVLVEKKRTKRQKKVTNK